MLLKNGIVVSGSGCTRQDIRMDEGRILQTGAGLNPLEGEEVMDVSGCLVAPEESTPTPISTCPAAAS